MKRNTIKWKAQMVSNPQKTFCGACCGDKEGCLNMHEIEVVKRPNSAQWNEQINFEDEKEW